MGVIKMTIKEIAALAGVSPSTVSRVINQNGRFSKETEQRVRAVIEQHHFLPNMAAKGLRTQKNAVVGVVVPDITNTHFSSLVWQIETILFEKGYSCMICNTGEQEKLEERHIRVLAAQNVSGVILISSTRIYRRLQSIPTVYLDRRPKWYSSSCYLVESDNRLGGYLAAKELLEQGCQKMAILRAENLDANQMQRYEGFQKALLEAGYFKGDWVDICTKDALPFSGEQEVSKAVAASKRFDGLMCTTDTLAAGAILGLRRRQLSVPGDCLITGYDDSLLAKCLGTGITSVQQKIQEMAQIGTQLLLQLEARQTPSQKHVVLPVKLIPRDSTRGGKGKTKKA